MDGRQEELVPEGNAALLVVQQAHLQRRVMDLSASPTLCTPYRKLRARAVALTGEIFIGCSLAPCKQHSPSSTGETSIGCSLAPYKQHSPRSMQRQRRYFEMSTARPCCQSSSPKAEGATRTTGPLITCTGLSSMMALRISISFCLDVPGPCKNLCKGIGINDQLSEFTECAASCCGEL